ncbi:uncharacterized protein LOC125538076 [Triticum urartu]|uniref:uncharacterized protein LOC125538076 n=1 Tax=Triticum urartu TaxID=4572 RepID=UPI002042C03A|nr:uncharacterized protein LOC125538076 [Triticum urartu]
MTLYRRELAGHQVKESLVGAAPPAGRSCIGQGWIGPPPLPHGRWISDLDPTDLVLPGQRLRSEAGRLSYPLALLLGLQRNLMARMDFGPHSSCAAQFRKVPRRWVLKNPTRLPPAGQGASQPAFPEEGGGILTHAGGRKEREAIRAGEGEGGGSHPRQREGEPTAPGGRGATRAGGRGSHPHWRRGRGRVRRVSQ